MREKATDGKRQARRNVKQWKKAWNGKTVNRRVLSCLDSSTLADTQRIHSAHMRLSIIETEYDWKERRTLPLAHASSELLVVKHDKRVCSLQLRFNSFAQASKIREHNDC